MKKKNKLFVPSKDWDVLPQIFGSYYMQVYHEIAGYVANYFLHSPFKVGSHTKISWQIQT